MDSDQDHPPMDLTLARAAAAFRDADFFEACVLFWSAVLDPLAAVESEADLTKGLDLEEELGLDVQAEEPFELVFPAHAPSDTPHIDAHTITSIQTYTLTALCYLSRHINVRIDFLPSGRDTLTTLGPPQRYYGALTSDQKELYQQLLAIVLATAAKVSQKDSQVDQQHRVQQATILGNEATVIWQTTITQKQAPHNLPRFFSFLNPNSCTVAGCSIPRNELDIDALAQNGFRLVITLIRESPLSPTWFLHSDNKTHSIIRNAFVPIENRKAPEYPEVFEVLMGWCLRAGASIADNKDGPTWQHQRATLIHCGGGKGRAGIVLAAHLIRYGLAGHDHRGYCAECLRNENVHRYDLEQFRKGLGDREVTASTLPEICSFTADEDDTNDDEDEEPDEIEFKADGGCFRVVSPYKCLNRYRPMMTARDAMAHLREIRPGSIESVEQEKAVKAYGDWLWKKSSSGSKRSRAKIAAQESSTSVEHAEDMPVTQSTGGPSSGNPDRPKQKKEKKKEAMPKSQTLPPAMADEEGDDFSGDEFGRGRKSGKKGKKNSRKLPQEQPRVFVPPPADKIIKIPGSHHQHHLVVQHNIRARQLQRGQKSKKKNGGGGKQSKERPSYSVSGNPLTSAPKLIILAGLPGSGKSHLATTLLDEFPDHFVRISQDELGSRAVCERLLAQSMRHQQQSLVVRGPKKALPMTIVIDRCNPTMAERKEWYEVAFQPDETAMVWFSTDLEHCIERVDSRENHPTVGQGMGSKVVRSFAKSFESPNLSKEGSWCKTLIEVGDDDGCDRLLEVMRKFARDIPGSSGSRKSREGKESMPVKARPAFIPTRVLQRKQSGSASPDGDSATVPGAPSLTSKTLSTGSMASVEEGEEEDDDEDHSDDSEEDDSEDEEDVEEDDETQDDEDDVGQETETATNDKARFDSARAASPSAPQLSSLSISKALQFASPTGYRPAVKRPTKGSWKGSAVDTQSLTNDTTGSVSPKGVSFATPLSTFDRPLQKFPRTPHLFDPLTILESWEQNSDRMVKGGAVPSHTGESSLTKGRSSAISRSDLLLPPSAIRQVFAPKPHQVLTIEEKMDGANIGFSVLHFKTMDGFAGVSSVTGPPPKIRVQNRNHFVHPDDHWQFKKLNGWLEKHREDVLWLCEGRWRYETREKQGCGAAGVDQDSEEANEESSDDRTGSPLVPGIDDQDWEDEESDGDDVNEYVDENEVLQDGMAPYVLYGEWLYAKHSVKYTGLRSWFVPFDLLDVKTGTFVSRAVFQNAVAQTHLVPNPVIKVPQDVQGDVEKTLRWTLESLHGRSALMKPAKAGVSTEEDDALRDRVEGLYFRIDQGDRLLMRSKVVRPDFIAGEERWGTKEQVANQLGYHFGGEYENA